MYQPPGGTGGLYLLGEKTGIEYSKKRLLQETLFAIFNLLTND